MTSQLEIAFSLGRFVIINGSAQASSIGIQVHSLCIVFSSRIFRYAESQVTSTRSKDILERPEPISIMVRVFSVFSITSSHL